MTEDQLSSLAEDTTTEDTDDLGDSTAPEDLSASDAPKVRTVQVKPKRERKPAAQNQVAQFALGAEVSWTSAGSRGKVHVGEVVEIVKAGDSPALHEQDGGARKHVSYVVREGEQTFWPFVSQLKLAKMVEHERQEKAVKESKMTPSQAYIAMDNESIKKEKKGLAKSKSKTEKKAMKKTAKKTEKKIAKKAQKKVAKKAAAKQAKAPAKKKSTAKKVAKKTTAGKSPPLTLTPAHEAILGAFGGVGKKATLAQLTEKAWKGWKLTEAKAKSWTRNQLRFLRFRKFVAFAGKKGEGVYELLQLPGK